MKETTYKDVAEALIEELRHRADKDTKGHENQDMVSDSLNS